MARQHAATGADDGSDERALLAVDDAADDPAQERAQAARAHLLVTEVRVGYRGHVRAHGNRRPALGVEPVEVETQPAVALPAARRAHLAHDAVHRGAGGD